MISCVDYEGHIIMIYIISIPIKSLPASRMNASALIIPAKHDIQPQLYCVFSFNYQFNSHSDMLYQNGSHKENKPERAPVFIEAKRCNYTLMWCTGVENTFVFTATTLWNDSFHCHNLSCLIQEEEDEVRQARNRTPSPTLSPRHLRKHLVGDWTKHLSITIYHRLTSTNQINIKWLIHTISTVL